VMIVERWLISYLLPRKTRPSGTRMQVVSIRSIPRRVGDRGGVSGDGTVTGNGCRF